MSTAMKLVVVVSVAATDTASDNDKNNNTCTPQPWPPHADSAFPKTYYCPNSSATHLNDVLEGHGGSMMCDEGTFKHPFSLQAFGTQRVRDTVHRGYYQRYHMTS